tara:strand:+ start:2452 stop:2634 length:183 start_codon:yes stop_codon:yes gene_type:complete
MQARDRQEAGACRASETARKTVRKTIKTRKTSRTRKGRTERWGRGAVQRRLRRFFTFYGA